MAKKLIENTIYLADGTELHDSNAGYSKPDLWCSIRGKTMMECMQMFSDRKKISEITVYNYSTGYRYIGFTNLLVVQKSQIDDDMVDVRLTWPEGGAHYIQEIKPEEEEDDGSVLPK